MRKQKFSEQEKKNKKNQDMKTTADMKTNF